MSRPFLCAIAVFAAYALPAQTPPRPEIEAVLRVSAPLVALTNVSVIDGTGAGPSTGQTIVIDHGKIRDLGPVAAIQVPPGATVIDLPGRTVLPGFVLMHEHLFYPALQPGQYVNLPWSFTRLYLAAGVTTMRTGGSLEPYFDINTKQAIDAGRAPGPDLYITAAYVEGDPPSIAQFHALKSPDEARAFVNYWADQGATSFKAYRMIRRAELQAAIDAAHLRGIKVTGHLCAVTFREAAALGIDNLEHGVILDTELAPGRKPDECPQQGAVLNATLKAGANDPRVKAIAADLIERKVALTSTLAVFEAFDPARPLPAGSMDVLAPEFREQVERMRASAAKSPMQWSKMLEMEQQFERGFVEAGGLLLAGTDPTGNGGAIPGFASRREIELLVEAGLAPVVAIRIATANGAHFLGIGDRVGTITRGKQADLVVVRGDPSRRIADIENTEIVFRNGLGYDPEKLIAAVKGTVGRR